MQDSADILPPAMYGTVRIEGLNPWHVLEKREGGLTIIFLFQWRETQNDVRSTAHVLASGEPWHLDFIDSPLAPDTMRGLLIELPSA